MLAVLVALVILSHYTGILNPLERALSSGLNPVSSFFYSQAAKIREVWNIREGEGDREQIERLQEKVEELTAENAELKVVKKESEILKNFLELPKRDKFEQRMARVISRGMWNDPREEGVSFLINKGEKHGLKRGMAVVNERGIVVGKLTETEDAVSRVLTLTDDECELAASIQNEEGTMGIVKGEMGLTAQMEYIPQTEEISPGDRVVTSGLEKNIPAGLAMGEVTRVENDSNQVWQTATVEPLTDIKELTMVAVMVDR